MSIPKRVASMRPRHKAAEYHVGRQGRIQQRGVASMRPRHKAAEYRHIPLERTGTELVASMRPRHKAAEYRHRAGDVVVACLLLQ